MSWFDSIFDWFQSWWRRLIEIILQWLASHSGGGGTISDDRCCSLARRDNECHWFGSKSNYTCPEGYTRQWWYCCEGTQQIGCGECTPQATCWQGPWECSIWWYTGATC